MNSDSILTLFLYFILTISKMNACSTCIDESSNIQPSTNFPLVLAEAEADENDLNVLQTKDISQVFENEFNILDEKVVYTTLDPTIGIGTVPETTYQKIGSNIAMSSITVPVPRFTSETKFTATGFKHSQSIRTNEIGTTSFEFVSSFETQIMSDVLESAFSDVVTSIVVHAEEELKASMIVLEEESTSIPVPMFETIEAQETLDVINTDQFVPIPFESSTISVIVLDGYLPDSLMQASKAINSPVITTPALALGSVSSDVINSVPPQGTFIYNSSVAVNTNRIISGSSSRAGMRKHSQKFITDTRLPLTEHEFANGGTRLSIGTEIYLRLQQDIHVLAAMIITGGLGLVLVLVLDIL